VILKHAGTAAYNEVHPPSLLNDHLTPSKRTGKLDTSTLPPSWPQQHQQQSLPAPSPSSPAAASTKPPLETLISSHDFEAVAARTLSKKTWAFFSSAATDLVTAKANRAVFDRAWWQPRVLRSVRDVNTRTRILGCESAVPFFCAPAAMARLAHPEGERAIAAACGRKGVIQCVSVVFCLSFFSVLCRPPYSSPLLSLAFLPLPLDEVSLYPLIPSPVPRCHCCCCCCCRPSIAIDVRREEQTKLMRIHPARSPPAPPSPSPPSRPPHPRRTLSSSSSTSTKTAPPPPSASAPPSSPSTRPSPASARPASASAPTRRCARP